MRTRNREVGNETDGMGSRQAVVADNDDGIQDLVSCMDHLDRWWAHNDR